MNLRAIILMTAAGLGLLELSGEAQVYNLHWVTGNQPDYTDFGSFAHRSRAKAWGFRSCRCMTR